MEIEGRSARKRRAIVEAARTVFLRSGYAGASMDEVAALAEVSKQTVYKHFADKERLFTEIIVGDIKTTEERSDEIIESLPASDDIDGDLRALGRQIVVNVMQPRLVRLRRIIIGEVDRFPDVARTWFDSAPGRSYAMLADRFGTLHSRGLLHTPDPMLAAQHFLWLVLSIPMNKAMFEVDENPFTPEELERFADEGVRVFMAAYGR
ncbi:TetR/AcrR family transcriptional regulator [Lentzea tibetensis]|uniref:TetR/AcrR family transcriptional regulator n=1 Tax=Lentzea tibetensis TaxID=2591470 RepID=A0A563ESR6_9PSEU|nr:TetR/AcrR family transcriptional regulator [Lentzea tibetensis]TWP50719.1 TetR/AcrR family transcriptional regulator [Lentzea tibetensis]